MEESTSKIPEIPNSNHVDTPNIEELSKYINTLEFLSNTVRFRTILYKGIQDLTTQLNSIEFRLIQVKERLDKLEELQTKHG